MTTRRALIAGAALAAPIALALRPALGSGKKGAEGSDRPEFLFVQSARSVTYKDEVLTLKGVSPLTILFSDRPERLAGHMTTASFVPFWSNGDNSFASDPPNATLSVLDGEEVGDSVVELRDPRLEGEDLSYQVRILEGKVPASAGAASLFIDIIGMPLTPVSFAGARRRMWRRRVY